MKRSLRLTASQRIPLIFCSLVAVICLCGPASVLGYHFFYLSSGANQLAARWRTLPVNLVVDNAPASFQTDAQTAVNTWNNVATAKDVFGTLSTSSTDFTGSNFNTAWGMMPAGGDGQHEVVFDADGSALTRVGVDPTMFNGVAPTRKEIVGGEAVIVDTYFIVNGSRTNFDRLSTMVHELGHVQGIAHSSVGMHNSASPAGGALDVINVGSVPTMHPFSVGGTARRSLEPDDVAALSELYPEPSFATSTGSIEGVVKRCGNEDGVIGANVRAVNTSNSSIQLSRFTGFDGNTEGRFIIRGLPAGSYRLIVEPMGANDFNIASRFGTPPVRQEQDFETEYHNPPQEDDCSEEIPDTPVNIAVASGGAAMGKNFRVSGARLAFVVDDTGSMNNEIGAVRTILSGFVSVLDNLNRTLGIPFPTTTIVTFKDNVTRRVTSNNAARLQEIISTFTATGGGDCPEAANTALLTAGRLLRNGGVVMLFTDANSRPDGPTRMEVSQLYRSKSLKSFTLLSGTCDGGIPTLAPSSSSSCEPMCAGRSINLDEFPLPPTLGNENAVRTFSEIATETGGIFTAIPGIKENIPVEVQRYINSGTNIAVSSVVPAIGLVTPGDAPRGSAINFEIRGSNTNFQSSSVVSFSGSGVTVNSLTVNSPESITVNATVQTAASVGFRDVTVMTALGGSSVEMATGMGALNIMELPASATIIGVSPPRAPRGQTINVEISAVNSNFAAGTSIANFGTGVTVNSTTVLSSTSAVANITVAADTPIGFRNVRVTTGSEVATENVVGPFLVTAPPPAIPRLIGVSPSQGPRGTTLDLLITGENVNFVNGASVASFSGTGITVNSTTVTSPSTVQINLTIAPSTELGFRDVFVTTGSDVAVILRGFQVTVLSSVQLQAASPTVNEGTGSFDLIITRVGNTSGSASVGYATTDGTARDTSDYTTALGIARFAPGETTKRIPILITDDGFVEGDETLNITLANVAGTELGAPNTAILTIVDNDTSPATINPLDDARFFVVQHYYDFLNRVPDEPGLNFWTQQITQCGAVPECIEVRRIGVSASFFLSIEFQETGYLAYRIHKAAFGNLSGKPVPVRLRDFLADSQAIGRDVQVRVGEWERQLEDNKNAFTAEFVTRTQFVSLYPQMMTPAAFVDALNMNAGGALSQVERDALVADLTSGVKTRAQVLRAVAEDADFAQAERNKAFVLAQYFGYLRRNPDDLPDSNFDGYNFWLDKLNRFNGDFIRAELVTAFISSIEYRERYGTP